MVQVSWWQDATLDDTKVAVNIFEISGDNLWMPNWVTVIFVDSWVETGKVDVLHLLTLFDLIVELGCICSSAKEAVAWIKTWLDVHSFNERSDVIFLLEALKFVLPHCNDTISHFL